MKTNEGWLIYLTQAIRYLSIFLFISLHWGVMASILIKAGYYILCRREDFRIASERKNSLLSVNQNVVHSWKFSFLFGEYLSFVVMIEMAMWLFKRYCIECELRMHYGFTAINHIRAKAIYGYQFVGWFLHIFWKKESNRFEKCGNGALE